MYSGDKNLGQNIIPLEVVSFGRIVVHEASLTQHYLKELYERLPELLAYLEGVTHLLYFWRPSALAWYCSFGGKKRTYQTKEKKGFPCLLFTGAYHNFVLLLSSCSCPALFIHLTSFKGTFAFSIIMPQRDTKSSHHVHLSNLKCQFLFEISQTVV